MTSSAKSALSLAEEQRACLSWMCRRIPTAEERVLNTPQCGFESRRRHCQSYCYGVRFVPDFSHVVGIGGWMVEGSHGVD